MYDVSVGIMSSGLTRVQADNTFEFPLARFLAAITPRTKLILVASPNNPTGVTIPREAPAPDRPRRPPRRPLRRRGLLPLSRRNHPARRRHDPQPHRRPYLSQRPTASPTSASACSPAPPRSCTPSARSRRPTTSTASPSPSSPKPSPTKPYLAWYTRAGHRRPHPYRALLQRLQHPLLALRTPTSSSSTSAPATPNSSPACAPRASSSATAPPTPAATASSASPSASPTTSPKASPRLAQTLAEMNWQRPGPPRPTLTT